MIWFRIDNRLIHGQIIETWLPYTRASHLVVCNDLLVKDELRQQIMLLAVPSRIQTHFVSPASLVGFLDRCDSEANKILVIFADCADADAAYIAGTRFDTLNIGNMHYAPGKRQICGHVAMSAEDERCLRKFSERQVDLDFRCVPNDTIDLTDW